ncbi:unnamed protein product [Enterobius vermicularis]|uniref:HATPase_c domain-containing protein n=1 Tax=Enterobius vermicularis TaxID=51028 RepID=A0A0N4VP10_ENTVE|nr:unnamed protein product [Enterobius vermicularis]
MSYGTYGTTKTYSTMMLQMQTNDDDDDFNDEDDDDDEKINTFLLAVCNSRRWSLVDDGCGITQITVNNFGTYR